MTAGRLAGWQWAGWQPARQGAVWLEARQAGVCLGLGLVIASIYPLAAILLRLNKGRRGLTMRLGLSKERLHTERT